MPAPDSQNPVANHIPSMFSTVQGRSWGVASMVAECSKIEEKILERSINESIMLESRKEDL